MSSSKRASRYSARRFQTGIYPEAGARDSDKPAQIGRRLSPSRGPEKAQSGADLPHALWSQSCQTLAQGLLRYGHRTAGAVAMGSDRQDISASRTAGRCSTFIGLEGGGSLAALEGGAHELIFQADAIAFDAVLGAAAVSSETFVPVGLFRNPARRQEAPSACHGGERQFSGGLAAAYNECW